MNYPIFEYKEFASCNFLGGNTNSFEIKIQENGTIEYKESDFIHVISVLFSAGLYPHQHLVPFDLFYHHLW